eukprot:PhM_4_TR3452/c3_g1_i3/m.62867
MATHTNSTNINKKSSDVNNGSAAMANFEDIFAQPFGLVFMRNEDGGAKQQTVEGPMKDDEKPIVGFIPTSHHHHHHAHHHHQHDDAGGMSVLSFSSFLEHAQPQTPGATTTAPGLSGLEAQQSSESISLTWGTLNNTTTATPGKAPLPPPVPVDSAEEQQPAAAPMPMPVVMCPVGLGATDEDEEDLHRSTLSGSGSTTRPCPPGPPAQPPVWRRTTRPSNSNNASGSSAAGGGLPTASSSSPTSFLTGRDVAHVYDVGMTCVVRVQTATIVPTAATTAADMFPKLCVWEAGQTCPHRGQCPHVHVIPGTSLQPSPIHASANAANIPRHPAGRTARVYDPHQRELSAEVPSDHILRTVGSDEWHADPNAGLRVYHCAHFLSKGVCHRGAECTFFHVVPSPSAMTSTSLSSSPNQQQQQQKADAVASTLPTTVVVPTQQQQQQQHMPPTMMMMPPPG